MSDAKYLLAAERRLAEAIRRDVASEQGRQRIATAAGRFAGEFAAAGIADAQEEAQAKLDKVVADG